MEDRRSVGASSCNSGDGTDQRVPILDVYDDDDDDDYIPFMCSQNRQRLLCYRARLKHDGTRAKTRFRLSAKRTSPFKLAGSQFSRLMAAEVCASAVVMVVMLDTPCSEVECKTTGYPLHSHVSPSLTLPCVTVCHQVFRFQLSTTTLTFWFL